MPIKYFYTVKVLILIIIILLLPVSIFAKAEEERATSANIQKKSLIKAGNYSLPIVKEKMTLSYAGLDYALYSLNDNREIWQEFEKRTNIAIEWQCIVGKDYNVAINLRASAGTDLPDMFDTGQHLKVSKLAHDKVIIKTTDLISKYAPNIKKEIQKSPLVRAMMINVDGELYSAFPSTKQHNEKTNIKSIYYRDDWRKQLNLKKPETVEEYFEMFSKFVKEDVNGNGIPDDEIGFIPRWFAQFSPLGLGFDLRLGASNGWQVKNGKVQFDYTRNEFKNFLSYCRKYYEEKIIPKSVWSDKKQVDQIIASNRAGAYFNGLSSCMNSDRLIKKAGVDLSKGGYTYAAPPINKRTGKRQTESEQYVSERSVVISKLCKHPDVAIRWLDYVWGSEEGRTLTNWGFEGIHHKLDKNRNPYYTDLILNHPDGYSGFKALAKYGGNPNIIGYIMEEAFLGQFVNNKKIFNMPADAEKYYTLTNPIPKMQASIEEGEEYFSIVTDLNTLKDEYCIKFISGELELDMFDEFVKKMKQIGLIRLAEIKQNMYNRLQKQNI